MTAGLARNESNIFDTRSAGVARTPATHTAGGIKVALSGNLNLI